MTRSKTPARHKRGTGVPLPQWTEDELGGVRLVHDDVTVLIAPHGSAVIVLHCGVMLPILHLRNFLDVWREIDAAPASVRPRQDGKPRHRSTRRP